MKMAHRLDVTEMLTFYRNSFITVWTSICYGIRQPQYLTGAGVLYAGGRTNE
jgi:hypothetical protein